MKRLIVDIETAPHKVYTWGLFNQNIAINQIDKPGYILCWSAKWHGKPKVRFRSIHHHGREDMLGEIYDLFEEADGLIHYNGQRFDIPTLNQEFMSMGWPMPTPPVHIDLLLTVRKQFRLASNKLAYVADYLGVGGKAPSFNMDLWRGCMAGDAASWREMKRYNMNDVVITEAVYDRLLAWVPNHPNLALFHKSAGIACASCGGSSLMKRGFQRTKVRSYQRYQCRDCGAWSKERAHDKTAPKTRLVGV